MENRGKREPSSSADYSGSCTVSTGREPQELEREGHKWTSLACVGRKVPENGRGAPRGT